MTDIYDQDDPEPVDALAMTPRQAYLAFMDVIFTSYTAAEIYEATRVQMTEAIKHTQYLLWLHSEPSQEEIADAMRTLTSAEIEP